MKNNIFTCLFGAILLLLTGSSISVAQTTPDPGIAGPYAVTKGEYNLGDAAATLPSLPNPAEVRASVHYPTSLTGGPFPVIVLLHGRHSTCYDTITNGSSLNWPCPAGRKSIVSYQGYDYHARFMASHGYIVISISCNSINAQDNPLPDRGMNARGELVQYHLDLWNTWNTTGGAPASLGAASLFVGKLNMQKIGTMGHSRGGEGVVYHALLNRSLGSPYGVKAVITLAPVDFFRRKLNGIPLLNIAPYCDGDVSDLQGVHFYDDVRYTDTLDESPKHNILMMGANHNFYNTVWTPGSYIAGTSDDWSAADAHCRASTPGNKRFDTTKQKMAYNTYASAFFRQYVGGEQQFAPILETKDIIPPVTSLLDTSNVFVSFHPGRTERRDLNRIDTIPNETTNTIGGAVTQAGLVVSGICGGGTPIPACAVATQQAREPHRGTYTAPILKGLAQMGVQWNDTLDWYMNDIPAAHQNLTLTDAIQFRAALRYNTSPAGQIQNYTVQLIDSAGAISSEQVRTFSRALFYPPGTSASLLPKVMFNTIRIPIDSFTGINRAKVRKVKFLFNKTTAGAILFSDIAFVNSKCGLVNSSFGHTYDTVGYDVSFFDTITSNPGDTVVRLWNFGDTASGVNDTSTAHNPIHVYSSVDTFRVCMYTKVKRRNNWICTDTVCKDIRIVFATSVKDIHAPSTINIIPNPARDYVQIQGAKETDVLRLINAMGQVVLTTQITDPIVRLPQTLANGIYYAIITTSTGQTTAKLVINR
ncbi:MAG: T9SS type A sorting domain-containing protein [Taibaiella sp.]|nr:T9SS type A sorting domain-containing protein [Taibaiella sp.]